MSRNERLTSLRWRHVCQSSIRSGNATTLYLFLFFSLHVMEVRAGVWVLLWARAPRCYVTLPFKLSATYFLLSFLFLLLYFIPDAACLTTPLGKFEHDTPLKMTVTVALGDFSAIQLSSNRPISYEGRPSTFERSHLRRFGHLIGLMQYSQTVW